MSPLRSAGLASADNAPQGRKVSPVHDELHNPPTPEDPECGTAGAAPRGLWVHIGQHGHLRQALAVLPPRARPEPGLTHTVDCGDPTDDGPAGRKTASVTYQVLGPQAAEGRFPRRVWPDGTPSGQ